MLCCCEWKTITDDSEASSTVEHRANTSANFQLSEKPHRRQWSGRAEDDERLSWAAKKSSLCCLSVWCGAFDRMARASELGRKKKKNFYFKIIIHFRANSRFSAFSEILRLNKIVVFRFWNRAKKKNCIKRVQVDDDCAAKKKKRVFFGERRRNVMKFINQSETANLIWNTKNKKVMNQLQCNGCNSVNLWQSLCESWNWSFLFLPHME